MYSPTHEAPVSSQQPTVKGTCSTATHVLVHLAHGGLVARKGGGQKAEGIEFSDLQIGPLLPILPLLIPAAIFVLAKAPFLAKICPILPHPYIQL